MICFNMKKLSKQDRANLWGESGPYSEVCLTEETRILDDVVSRVFLTVEVKMNPFTFEYVLKNREKFDDNKMIQQLLDCAEYRGSDFGYIISLIKKGKINKAKLRVEKFINVLEYKHTEKDKEKNHEKEYEHEKYKKPNKLSQTDAEMLLNIINQLLDNLN